MIQPVLVVPLRVNLGGVLHRPLDLAPRFADGALAPVVERQHHFHIIGRVVHRSGSV